MDKMSKRKIYMIILTILMLIKRKEQNKKNKYYFFHGIKLYIEFFIINVIEV